MYQRSSGYNFGKQYKEKFGSKNIRFFSSGGNIQRTQVEQYIINLSAASNERYI